MKSSTVLSIQDVLQATGGQLRGGRSEGVFRGVSTDSRQISGGNLFICLEGENFDGHHFMGAAVAGGATGLVVRKGAGVELRKIYGGTPVILVKDTLAALGDIARFWRRKMNVPVIAITGSSGKTTTKEMTAAILGQTGKVLKTEGNFNNQIGLPLTLLRLNRRHEVVVVEMGTNRPGEIGRLTRIAEPEIGLITNIGPAHLEGLKSLELIRKEKGDLFQKMTQGGTAIVNADDEALQSLNGQWQGRRLTFGLKRKADVTAVKIRKRKERGMIFTLKIGQTRGDVELRAAGEHNLYNALAAAAAAMAYGADPGVICRGLASFQPMPGRFEIHPLRRGAYLINDAYNANPLSVQEALKTLRELKGRHRSAVILGDMLELGRQAGALHADIGRLIAETDVDQVFLKGDFSRATAAGAMAGGMAEQQVFFYEQPGQILDRLRPFLQRGNWILVKGSRKMRMEEVVQSMIEDFGSRG